VEQFLADHIQEIAMKPQVVGELRVESTGQQPILLGQWIPLFSLHYH
jgi:hypothetical protein